MALLQTGSHILPEVIEAANGRFFDSSEPREDMYTFSQSVFFDTTTLLPNDRGILAQFPIYDVVSLDDDEQRAPQPTAIHSLAIDGSRHNVGELAWRYTVAVPYQGRTVQDLYVGPHSLEARTIIYDQQGALRRQDNESDASALAQNIRAIVDGSAFKLAVSNVVQKRAEAVDSFEQFMADLIARGVDLKKMKALIDKREATVKRRGFVACSAIVHS